MSCLQVIISIIIMGGDEIRLVFLSVVLFVAIVQQRTRVFM